MFSLDPGALENVDKSVDNDDQDDEDVAGGDGERHHKQPRKIHFVNVVNGNYCIGHADAAVQHNNLIQECHCCLFEDHSNNRSIGEEDRNDNCPH